ncbi:hypothetical protein HanPI659440_Chr06g0251961 [Helianthus annuus]|nr:hypothetical protein HanPI659440_Chr06g0251961 [Helianthus annuus]
MDQQKSKSKNTILKFLPRATSSISFQNPLIHSPKPSEKPHKSHIGITFSGPLLSTDQTRRKIKNHSDHTITYEPTSPRVSCMGQVKCKYTKQKQKPKPQPTGKDFRQKSATPDRTRGGVDVHASHTESKGKKKLGFTKLLSFGGKKQDKKSNVPMFLDKVPSLSTMKRFSSGREKLSDIDWTRNSMAVDSGDRNYDSDEGDVIVPSSAPVVIRNPLGFDDNLVRVAGNTEPRKEINLWKRRTMTQPKPLLLHKI